MEIRGNGTVAFAIKERVNQRGETYLDYWIEFDQPQHDLTDEQNGQPDRKYKCSTVDSVYLRPWAPKKTDITMITTIELYEHYVATLLNCTPEILETPDEEMLCHLFEDGFTSALSFLHDVSLSRLRNAGHIDDEMVAVSKDVRRRWVRLEKEAQEQVDFSVERIRNDEEWKQLAGLCAILLNKA